MNRMIQYVICLVITSLPWLFLFEVFPIPYHRIGVPLEVLLEILMFFLLIAVLVYLRKERKRTDKNVRLFRVLNLFVFLLALITAFLLGVILVIMGIAQLV